MHRPSPIRTIAAAATAAQVLLAGNAGAQYAVSQQPVLTPSPPTNVVLMLDDSGSMAWAFVPDAYGACTGYRRFNAGTFNALAYNPNIVYQSPTIITASGPQIQRTSFTAAWIDGFNTKGANAVAIDLSSGYQPTASYSPGQSGQQFSPHPSQGQDLINIFSPNPPPANAAAGGTGTNCGGSYAGTGGGGGGNQFGPQTSTDTAVGAAAYYYVYNTSCTSTVIPPTNDDACYVYTRVTDASAPAGATDVDSKPILGKQNFANWYSFYRTRHLMIASAAAAAMADPVLTQTRVTWRALNSCTDMVGGPTGNNACAGWDGFVVDNLIRTFNDTPVTTNGSGLSQRAAFYQWLTRVPASSPTPTRSTWTYIGDYFSTPSSSNTALGSTALGANGPYGINPNPADGSTPPSGEIACVQNYNITLTDGQWNQDQNGSFFGKADATATTLPVLPTNVPPPTNPVPYVPSATPIYGNDTNSDTLSDIAFHYWSTNLRPDLNNSTTMVPPYCPFVTSGADCTQNTVDYWNPQNDPATWPHVVQFTIGIGMTSTMNLNGLNWWGNVVGNQYKLDASTNPGFVTYNPATGAYPNAGYDNLWYGNAPWPGITNSATQGDTGKAYDLWHAALNSRGLAFSAESAADLVSSLKTSMNRIKANLAAKSAVAVSASKIGAGTQVYVASYSSQGWTGVLGAYPITTTGISTTPSWQTTDTGKFAAPSARLVMTSSAGTPLSSGAAPTSKGTTLSTQWTTIGGNSTLLSWLLGDASTEVRNKGPYRNRVMWVNGTPVPNILGDIIDSSPVFAWHENYGYASLPEGMTASPNYTTFLAGKGNTAGNGYTKNGMVYVGANDGMLHGFDAGTGYEVFGYVPYDVIPSLPALADPGYSHRFYVDQTPYVGDACVGSGPTSCIWKTVLVGTTGAGSQGVFALDVTNPQSMGTGSVMWDLDGLGTNDGSGDPDLGYPIGKPLIARLNNGDWVAVFGNGYLSSNGCAVLFMVKLSDGTVTKIGTTTTPGTGTGSSCTTTNIFNSNGLGPVTLADVDGNMTTDYVYAGDLQGNLWKFDLHTAASVPTGSVQGGLKLFAASPGCATSTGTTTCQPITSAPVLGLPLTGMTGTMVYFGTGRLFAVGDLSSTSTQSFYGILDSGGSTTIYRSQLVQQTITDSGNTRTISGNAVVAPGWFMDLGQTVSSQDKGERVTFSPLLLDGFVVFATEVPSSTSCSASGSGWIMAIPANSATLGGNDNFFIGNQGVAGIQASNGMPEGMSTVYDPTTKTDKLIVGETGGPQVASTKSQHLTGRISWHELSQ
jgi:type IV pilus assembly protein PilY1